MKAAFAKDDDFLADVAAAKHQPERLHLWWLGQSGFLVQWQGKHLLLDPYLSDSLTIKYAQTEKPHVRMTERVIAPERLDFIDVVTSSHNHTDHLDADTLIPILERNPNAAVVVSEANREFVAQRLNIDPDRPIGLNPGESENVAGFQLSPVPAAHEELERDELGRYRYVGFVVDAGPLSIYHSGDTVLYHEMADSLRESEIDIALLPINGSRPERQVAGNLNAAEAARLANDAGIRLAIPCHYDMFEFNTADPSEFVRECRIIGQGCTVLQVGQRWSSPA